MYSSRGGLILGFHGCDATVGESILAGKTSLRPSDNDYDWLGPGMYFWEGCPRRALQFAHEVACLNRHVSRGAIHKPFVLGAVIDPGHCCDLQSRESLEEVARAHGFLSALLGDQAIALPKNTIGEDGKLRRLDCAVIRMMHRLREVEHLPAYDSVRGAFWEGGPLYPGAGFSAKQHIQISVLSPDRILGFFRPRLLVH
jgi:hypothetical protein